MDSKVGMSRKGAMKSNKYCMCTTIHMTQTKIITTIRLSMANSSHDSHELRGIALADLPSSSRPLLTKSNGKGRRKRRHEYISPPYSLNLEHKNWALGRTRNAVLWYVFAALKRPVLTAEVGRRSSAFGVIWVFLAFSSGLTRRTDG